jgi:hypothetical protein
MGGVQDLDKMAYLGIACHVMQCTYGLYKSQADAGTQNVFGALIFLRRWID